LLGPLAAPGLAEVVAELQAMPDVEVITYWHPEWPSLVDDINHQSVGTHVLVIGYSLGANTAILVANKTNYIDSIIALQPSIFTSNTALTGSVGRIVEIYNPNPLMTFGGMGSQKLTGANIEYIVNNDSHLGAPFNPEFRNLVKSEIARLSAEQTPNTAQAQIAKASHPTKPESPEPYHGMLQPTARR
jgi:predicted dienelactone hydrolase